MAKRRPRPFGRIACVVLTAAIMTASLLVAPGAAYADECPAGGMHDYEVTIIRKATEDEDGLERCVCSKCGDTIERSIPATGHKWSDWYVVTPATCTSTGIEERVCTRYPNNPHYEQRTIPALSASLTHTYIESTRTDATCTEDGSVTYVCSVCGDTYTDALPALGHDWGDWETVTQPTATEDGVARRTCRRCGETEEQPIPATGATEPTTGLAEGSGGGDDEGGGAGFFGGFVSKEFFTAGPNRADAVMATSDGLIVIAFLVLSAPLVAQVLWLRRKKQGIQRDFGHFSQGRRER
ncbi:MAG: hypothetical protein LKI25_06115 [Atopobiaceae bacterium]|nr:hypothetical protein [Atopobiaceae bacterium]MCI2173772.1 hypothetical protein [Atopobiaceae bacterium]MCI2207586.1 hypothetical protein [Atopobiaceae bacterium]